MSMMWSARRIVSSSCSTTTSVLPLSPSLLQRVEQDAVVARVQADGRLVEHVAHALQVAAELRREADALRLAARERRRGAVERQVAEADLLEELEAAADLGDDVARDVGVAAGERAAPRPTCARRSTDHCAIQAIDCALERAPRATPGSGACRRSRGRARRRRLRPRPPRPGSSARGRGRRRRAPSRRRPCAARASAAGRCRRSSCTSRACCCS